MGRYKFSVLGQPLRGHVEDGVAADTQQRPNHDRDSRYYPCKLIQRSPRYCKLPGCLSCSPRFSSRNLSVAGAQPGCHLNSAKIVIVVYRGGKVRHRSGGVYFVGIAHRPGAGHRPSRHRESFDQARRRDLRNGANWRGEFEGSHHRASPN
jgi:hypothetical protein